MTKLVHMRHHFAKHKHWYGLAGLLVLVSGCTGAITQTGKQLGKDAMLPVTAPIDAYQGAKTKIQDIKQQQNTQTQEMEAVK